MKEFDYSAPAELFAGHGRSGLRYRRFTKSAEAIRYAMEKLPAAALSATPNPVLHGFAQGLNHPGGSITGLSFFADRSA